jgi:protein SCO1
MHTKFTSFNYCRVLVTFTILMNLKKFNMKHIIRIKNLKSIIIISLVLSSAISSTYPDYKEAKVVKHLGNKLPLNLVLINSKGEKVKLSELIDKPTIIDFCYYRCSGICTPLMTEIADVIGKVKYEPGRDYNILSISIDQNETPEMAAQKKNAMFGLINKKIPDSGWLFLTGDSTNIYQLTDAAGFEFKRTYGGFLHKGVLIFVDKSGEIVQYLSPGYTAKGDFQILPSSFEVALKGAQTGEISSTIESVLKTCYTFIPKGMDALVFGLILLTSLIVVVTVIIIIKRVKPRRSI